jgi:hypothetical protein
VSNHGDIERGLDYKDLEPGDPRHPGAAVPEPPSPLPADIAAQGRIFWERRYEHYLQQPLPVALSAHNLAAMDLQHWMEAVGPWSPFTMQCKK